MASNNASYQSILNDLNRDVARQQPDDIVQFCSDWFQDKLRQERSGSKSGPGSRSRTPGNVGSFSRPGDNDHHSGHSPTSEMGPTDGPFASNKAAAAGGFAAGGLAAGAAAGASAPFFSSPFGSSGAPSAPADDSSPFSENAPPVGVDFGASPFGPSAQTPSAPVGKGLDASHSDEEPSIPQYALGRRTSVSAESLQPAHARKTFDSELNSFAEEEDNSAAMPVFQKTPEQLKRIRDAIKDNFLFKNLDEEQEADVLNAMKEVTIPADDMIIKQGDAGDYFYIVEKGNLDIYVKKDGMEAAEGDKPGLGKKVASSYEGSSFGELALMHNAPRAATIISLTPCTLWALDRVSFRTILLDHTSRKRRLYESFLSTVPILSSLQPAERAKIADVLESRTFEAGQDIIKQGDMGDEFFLIEAGSAEAYKLINGQETRVKSMGPGDYFGELALLNRQARAATVRASQKVRVVALGEQAFTRLLGPVKDIMARNAGERYSS